MLRLDGVGGSAIIIAEGTIYILLTAQGSSSPTHLGIVHNTLHAPTVTSTTLLSVSQVQLASGNSCHLNSNEFPYINLGGVHFALCLSSGLFMMQHEAATDLEAAKRDLPSVTLTPAGSFTPPSTPRWSLTTIPSSPAYLKVLNFYRHSVDPKTFRDALAETDMMGTAITAMPPQDRTYSAKVPQDVQDFSKCLVTPSAVLTKATMALSTGLTLRSRTKH